MKPGMKRETARELIAGDWCVIAEYNGKPCKFQMVPVNELVKFRYALEKSVYGIAAVQLEKMLAVLSAPQHLKIAIQIRR